MSYRIKTIDAARGKWRGILMQLGIDGKFLVNKNGPCPICGGKDRFRFDNKGGNGTYYCNQCDPRSGSGIDLAKAWLKKSFKETADQIDAISGNARHDGTSMKKQEISDAVRLNLLKSMWMQSSPIECGDTVDKYLTSRGINQGVYPECLRFSEAVTDGHGGIHPAMLTCVGVHGEGKFHTIHRTFLKKDGSGKAEIAEPKSFMPGKLIDGCCAQLSEYTGGVLGIAEGVETALAATILYDVPVWAAMTGSMLARWYPPKGCSEVVIFGDNDTHFSGQIEAYTLAKRLHKDGIGVEVRFPDEAGKDFADLI